ncbi:MAG: leucine-rich repeat protein [Oscillospiraceae bacterium]|nr:leucine-rich repeat protein [Oscillospiraceae bacterium]
MKSITRKICTALMALTFVSAPLYSLPITSAAPAANEAVAYAADDIFYVPASSSTTENRFKYKIVSYTENGQTKQGVRAESVEIKKASVTVPGTVTRNGKTYTVVEIGNDFAARNSTITSLSLPSSLLKIGQGIGYNSANLSSVTFPNPNLTQLGGYAMHGTKYRQNQVNEGYAFFGNILFDLYPDKLIKNGKIDFSASKFNGITEIIPGIGSSASSVTELRLPKNIKKWDNLANSKYPNLTGLYFYNSNKSKYTDLKAIIKKHAENGVKLESPEITFIGTCEKFFGFVIQQDPHNPNEQPYKHAIEQSLAKKFLAEAGVTYYGSVQESATSLTAWKQYNAVRKIDCLCREKFTKGNETNSFVMALLLNKSMVCRHYAQLNQFMLICAGIEAKYMYSVGGVHAWNLVRIRDKDKGDFWFNVDADADFNPNRRYFMFTDIPEDATFLYANYHIRHPECNVTPWCNTQIGDIDNNGAVTTSDASAIRQAVNRIATGQSSGLLSIQEVLCDVDSDGQLTLNDAQIVRKYCAECANGTWNDTLEDYIVQKYPGQYPQNPQN